MGAGRLGKHQRLTRQVKDATDKLTGEETRNQKAWKRRKMICDEVHYRRDSKDQYPRSYSHLKMGDLYVSLAVRLNVSVSTVRSIHQRYCLRKSEQ